MMELITSNGYVVLIDDKDYSLVSQYKWRGLKGKYTTYAITGSSPTVYLHRMLTGAPKGTRVDHEDHNGLNNQRSNLRVCTNSQNQANRRKSLGKSSIYKGVSLVKATGRWEASIECNEKRARIGYFDSELEAAYAYNQAANTLFSDYALVNDLQETL